MKSFIYITLILGLAACTKKPKYDDAPEISFNENKTKVYRNIFSTLSSTSADSIIFAIDFKDGDGDLGYSDEDRLDTNNINFTMVEYVKFEGNWIENLTYKEQFQLLSSEELSGPIDGTLFNVKTFSYPYYNVSDTLKFMITIQDRAKHKSNTLESPEFIINHN